MLRRDVKEFRHPKPVSVWFLRREDPTIWAMKDPAIRTCIIVLIMVSGSGLSGFRV